MEDVLNASLAGGVIIGAASSLMMNPVGALIMGLIAGFLSVFGFWKVGPWLATKGLIDVCGIHNLHAVPGFLGGLASAVIFAISQASPLTIQTNPGSSFSYLTQGGMQVAGTLVSFAIASLTGYLVGLLLVCFKNVPAWDFFEDKAFWDISGQLVENNAKLIEGKSA